MLLQATTIIFLLVTFIIFKLSPGPVRKYVLLAGSVVFIYSEGGIFGLAVLGVITLVAYLAGLAVDCDAGNTGGAGVDSSGGAEAGSAGRKALAFISIVFLAFVLFGWKYIPWFLQMKGRETSVGMPIGLSFYTFQAISYIADLYMGRLKAPERNPFKFALYMMWFPKWMSGPIERTGQFMEQIELSARARFFDIDRFIRCMAYLIWGLFMKLVIADRIGIVVDSVYADLDGFGFIPTILASILYTIQIYCDFAGYTNSMIGVSGLFGIELTQNFKTPYLARSTVEFWRRWHISLSNFLRDYVYIPLGGNRKGAFRKMLNTLVVFIICGLWHGAGFSFLAWGLLHGLFNILADLAKKLKASFLVQGILGRFITFCLVSFAWIFFRASSVREAREFIRGMIPGVNPLSPMEGWVVKEELLLGISVTEWWIAGLAILLLVIMDIHAYKRDSILPEVIVNKWGDLARAAFLVFVALVVMITGKYGSGESIRSFMYMNF